MKQFLIIFFGLTLLLYVLFSRNQTNHSNDTDTISPTKSDEIPNAIEDDSPKNTVVYADKSYRFEYRKIGNSDKLLLIPNFKNKLSSEGITLKYDCDYGINGGFYTKENTPLGLFYTDESQMGQSIDSATFNGLFGLRKGSSPQSVRWYLEYQGALPIESDLESDFDFIFQTGPLYYLSLEYTNFIDKNFARRNLVAQDEYGDTYIFTIFDAESRYSGPRLEDIPNIFKTDTIKSIADFNKVLNLDGGSASAYIDVDSNTHITELRPIGSFLCGKK